MSNQQLMDQGNRMMDETDEAIERSKKVGISLIFFFCIAKMNLKPYHQLVHDDFSCPSCHFQTNKLYDEEMKHLR